MAVVSILLARAALNRLLRRIRRPAVRNPLLAAASLLAAFGYALGTPFLNDDYIFLDRTRGAGFASLWGTDALMFGWWRPLSREFHYWFLQRIFGARELGFHLVSLAIAIAVLALYFLVARRVAGAKWATVALAGVAALAAWAVPVLWVAGVQETWMLLFALAALLAFLSRAARLAGLLLAGALLSKETAVVVPMIAVSLALLVDRVSVRSALLRAIPMIVVTLIWALLHPVLRAALEGGVVTPEGAAPLVTRLGRTLLVPINLDHALAPAAHGVDILKRGLPATVPLLILLLYRDPLDSEQTARDRAPATPARRLAAAGAAWASFAWLPAFWPGAGWHSYYTLLGAMGAWLAIAPLLASRRWLAPIAVAALVFLRVIQGATPSTDWGTEWYQARAASFVSFLRSDLKRVAPTPAPHTRFFFTRVPSQIGFLTAGGPALRVWYRDPTLSGGFFSAYAPRDSGAAEGPDRFFRYDSTAGWIELVAGREATEAERRVNPQWAADHRELAARFAAAGDWRAAGSEFALLAADEPQVASHSKDAGVCFAMAGDSTSAARWFAVAARHPMADDQVKSWARAFERHLKTSP